MKSVKGVSFGVRFYRRAEKKAAKDAAPIANQSDAEKYAPSEKTIHTKLSTFSQSLMLPQSAEPSLNVPSPGKEGVSSLHRLLWHAAQEGDCAAIRRCVMDGADLDARDTLGRTVLNIATQYGQAQAIKTLLAAKEMRRLAARGELPDTFFFQKFRKKT